MGHFKCSRCNNLEQADEKNRLSTQIFKLSNYLSTAIERKEGVENENNGIDIDSPPEVSRVINETPNELIEKFNKFNNNFKFNKPTEDYATTKWRKQPYFFRNVHISLIALIKMMIHSVSGGPIEIMGMLVGFKYKNDLVVMDCFQLPVQGTESRVNPQNDSYEFMTKYLDNLKKNSNLENFNIIGWYHSHPGFGCWLSGIDVETQKLHQDFEDPYVAIVIDPLKSLKYNNIEIGAFRTFNEISKPNFNGNKNSNDSDCNKDYYALNVSVFGNFYDKLIVKKMLNYKQKELHLEDYSSLFAELSESMNKMNSKINEDFVDESLKMDEDYDTIKILRNLNTALDDYKIHHHAMNSNFDQKIISSNNLMTLSANSDESKISLQNFKTVMNTKNNKMETDVTGKRKEKTNSKKVKECKKIAKLGSDIDTITVNELNKVLMKLAEKSVLEALEK